MLGPGCTSSTTIDPVTLQTVDGPAMTRQWWTDAIVVWPCSQIGG